MFDLEEQWRLHPRAALRSEPFGALLYHFGTRKLSFLKNRAMVEFVRSLPEHASARAAGEEDLDAYVKASDALADSQMLEQTT